MVAPRTVVVGAGPSGLAASYLLQSLGYHVTLVERSDDPANANPARAFSYLVTFRGIEALRRMGLETALAECGTSGSNIAINVIEPGKKAKRISMLPNADSPLGKKASYWIARSSMVRLMLERVQELPNVDVRLGEAVSDVIFSKSSTQISLVDTSGKPSGTLDAELVVACDGMKSSVRNALKNAPAGIVQSACGFDVNRRTSPSVGLAYKTVLLGPAPILPQYNDNAPLDELDGLRGQRARPAEMFVLRGVLKGREHVRLGLLPVGSDEQVPRTGTITLPPDRTLWNVSDGEAAYDLFERNFPDINVRRLIQPDEMHRFAAEPKSHFPPIQRANSLVGFVSDDIGVVLLGDAAHAFPPDLGQGVNAALEDCVELFEALAAASTLREGLNAYEKGRSDDVSALMRLMQLGNPFQYRQDLMRLRLTMANQMLRSMLHKMAPNWFAPQVFGCINSGERYSETLRLVNETTFRIYAIGGSLIALIAALVKLNT